MGGLAIISRRRQRGRRLARIDRRRGWRIALGVVVLLVMMSGAALAATSFTDVPDDHPFAADIEELAALGVIDGFPDGTFRPGANLTRAQMAKIIVLALDRHTDEVDDPSAPVFSDVTLASGSPYPFDYVQEGAGAGFFQGSDGRFRPGEFITRAQLALILVRAGGDNLEQPPASFDDGFTDVPDFARNAVRVAKFNQILDGVSATRFAPYANATRGQSAKMLAGLIRVIVAAGGRTNLDAQRLVNEGRQIFRFDTFGDEAFWGDALQLHKAIAGSANGGVGDGVSPETALAVGLKVDVDALPKTLQEQLAQGKVDLTDPATTLALLKLNAVVGVTGRFDGSGNITSMGIQCALCHSTVDDSFAPGIGHRLDGWAAQDLNVGAIISLAPNLQAVADFLGTDLQTVKDVLAAWGPGKFDAQLFLDGKGFRPDGKTAATLIPPAFGLAGVNLHTSTGWGSVTYWNAFVANLEMHGQGTFFDPRLNDPVKYPVAVANGSFDVRNEPDLITPKLPALHFYQLALQAPKPPVGSFDPTAAERGKDLFGAKADCARCHVPPVFTEPGWNMHTGAEIGIDEFQALRSPDERYRTTPLKGLWSHMERGFFHDGRFATLLDVVNHYDTFFGLGLTPTEKADLVEYLKSI